MKAVGLVFMASVAACAPTGAAKTADQLKVIREEQTAKNLLERGKAFATVGDMTRAEQYFSAAIEAGANESEVTPLLVSACIHDGRYRLALEYAERYLKVHPRDHRMRLVVATLLVGVGQAAEAKEQLRQVVQMSPNDASAHYALASVLREEGDWVGADSHFREYLRVEPAGAHAEEARESLLKSVP